jgi:hypothetical protein
MNKKRRFRAPKGYLFSRSKLNQEKDINSFKRQRTKSRLGIQIVNKQGHVICASHAKTLKEWHNKSTYAFVSVSHPVANNRHKKGWGGVYPPIGLNDK